MTKNFKLWEFLESRNAIKNGINNEKITFEIAKNLIYTAECMEYVRELFGKPIKITSGYRCLKLNNLIGGSKTSQHMEGKAVDFVIKEITPKQICDTIRKSHLLYDQLILEPSWTHISFINEHLKLESRKEFLIKTATGYKKG